MEKFCTYSTFTGIVKRTKSRLHQWTRGERGEKERARISWPFWKYPSDMSFDALNLSYMGFFLFIFRSEMGISLIVTHTLTHIYMYGEYIFISTLLRHSCTLYVVILGNMSLNALAEEWDKYNRPSKNTL